MQPDFFTKKMRQMIYLTHIIFMVEYSGLEPLTPTLPVCSFCAQNYFKNQKMWQKCDVYCLTWLPVNVILG